MRRAGRIAAAAGALLLACALGLASAAGAPLPPERPQSERTTEAPAPLPAAAEPSGAAPAQAGGPAPAAAPGVFSGAPADLFSGDWANPPVLVFQDFSWWWDAPATPEVAARLFAQTCLAALPDFAGAGLLFEYLGFISVPGMRIRNHLEKKMSALATTPADLLAGGGGSCAVLVEGSGELPAVQAVEPMIVARFGQVQRHDAPAEGVRHAVWTVDSAAGPARISVTESAGDVHIAATVLPAAGRGASVTPAAR